MLALQKPMEVAAEPIRYVALLLLDSAETQDSLHCMVLQLTDNPSKLRLRYNVADKLVVGPWLPVSAAAASETYLEDKLDGYTSRSHKGCAPL